MKRKGRKRQGMFELKDEEIDKIEVSLKSFMEFINDQIPGKHEMFCIVFHQPDNIKEAFTSETEIHLKYSTHFSADINPKLMFCILESELKKLKGPIEDLLIM